MRVSGCCPSFDQDPIGSGGQRCTLRTWRTMLARVSRTPTSAQASRQSSGERGPAERGVPAENIAMDSI